MGFDCTCSQEISPRPVDNCFVEGGQPSTHPPLTTVSYFQRPFLNGNLLSCVCRDMFGKVRASGGVVVKTLVCHHYREALGLHLASGHSCMRHRPTNLGVWFFGFSGHGFSPHSLFLHREKSPQGRSTFSRTKSSLVGEGNLRVVPIYELFVEASARLTASS